MPVLTFDIHFVRKGCVRSFKNTTQVFDVPPSFRSKWLIWSCKIPTFAFDVLESQFYTSFCRSTFISCKVVHLQNCQFLTLSPRFVRKGGTTPQKVYISPHVCASDTRGLPRTNKIGMSADVCASDTHNLRIGSRFDGWGLAAPAAKREKVRRTWEIGVLRKFRHN